MQSMKEPDPRREYVSAAMAVNGFDKGGKNGQWGAEADGQIPRPESQSIRGICLVVRDYWHSGVHTRTHSKLMTLIPFLFGISYEVGNSKMSSKLSEVSTVLLNVQPREGGLSSLTLESMVFFLWKLPLHFMYFSITVYIPCYFELVPGVQHSVLFGFKASFFFSFYFVPSPYWIELGRYICNSWLWADWVRILAPLLTGLSFVI